jgi:DNA (cytosine-5)-methyltransferase 1
MTELAKFIIDIRLSLGLDRREFADLLGLNSNGINRVCQWENSYSKPTAVMLDKIVNLKVEAPFLQKNNNNLFTFIDLFAGIGGMRLALQNLGGQCIFSSEIDQFARKTYAKNFGDVPRHDIKKIPINEIPKHDILIAGFPCQSFSTAGKNLGFNDARGILFFEIEKILNHLHPSSFILENVKNLKNHDKGKTFELILKKLKAANYEVGYSVLNSLDYGCPQRRERIFIVGISKTRIKNLKFSDVFQWPEEIVQKKLLKDILEDNLKVNDRLTLSHLMYEGLKKRMEKNFLIGKKFGFKVFDKSDSHTGTLSARYFKDGKEILINQEDVKKRPRKITPREAARLQGFPDEFIVDSVSVSQIHKQFGNSISVPVVQAVGKSLLNSLNNLKALNN